MPLYDEDGFTKEEREAINQLSIATNFDEHVLTNELLKLKSDLDKLNDDMDELIKKIEVQPVIDINKIMRKKEKLPKKYRNGWT